MSNDSYDKLRASCVQFDIAWHDPRANFTAVRRLLRNSDAPRPDLLALPEMFATGFSMDARTVAGHAHASQAFLTDLAADLPCRALGGVANLAPDGRGVNEAVLFAPDGAQKLRYAKMHPFAPAGEPEQYAPGPKPVVVDVHAGNGAYKISAFICYDLRFPEVFRAAALGGAEVLAVIANWPASRAEHWRTLLIARAIENQAFVVGVNRVGADPNERYAGGSLIVDPRGRLLAEAGDGEAVLSAELDLASLRRYRAEFPALANARDDWVRRID